MRVSKTERKKNAVEFYNFFKQNHVHKAAIVVTRKPSQTNPYINRTQFWVKPNHNSSVAPVMIAESLTDGVEGCFIEFFKFIYDGIQKKYWEAEFNQWIGKTFGFQIIYNDDFVIMMQKSEDGEGL